MSCNNVHIDENSPISDVENILRRILNREDYFTRGLEIPVQRLAFKPTDNDTNGISVFRSMFVSPQEVAEAGPNNYGYYIAELHVSDVFKKNLTVIPNPLPMTDPKYLPGHSLIPEINIADYQKSTTNKKRIKEIQLALAILASKSIVYTPAKDYLGSE